MEDDLETTSEYDFNPRGKVPLPQFNFKKILTLSDRPRKNFFVSPTTFLRVEMCHQDSVIRDIKLDQKRA